MTRAEAKATLIASGVAEPTEEQISNLLNSVAAETKKEKDRADKLKEKADKADELQGKLDELEQNGLSDLEKEKKANEALQAQITEIRFDSFKSEAKAILKGAKLEDADIEALLPGMVAGLDKLEDVQVRANTYVSTMNKVRENAIKEYDKDALDGTRTPGAAGDLGDEGKTEAEKFAETMVKENASDTKGADEIIGAYK